MTVTGHAHSLNPENETVPQRELTESERRETLIDTFASWALEGMYPSAEDIALGREYIAGNITPAEIIAQTLAKYSET
ncbi:MAG: antitoxin VbhA family protein [Promicromonosporaceae bacterium]|nr:antitoxin VbhA family protein [Promicromonosporaceae bacterium]